MEEIFYLLLGWLCFNLFMFWRTKNKLDELKLRFNFRKYTHETWDDWLVTLALALGMYSIAPELFILIMIKTTWLEGVYWSNKIPFLIGAFGSLIFQGIYDIIKMIINKFKSKLE